MADMHFSPLYTQRLVIQSYISQFTTHGFQYQHYQSLYIKNELLWGHWSNGCRDIIFLWHVFKQHCDLSITLSQQINHMPSLNSTMALRALESARAITQNSFVLPQPSWRSTLMASSSSLNTYRIKKRTLIKYCQMSIEKYS